jgi:hypothetical protein
VSKMHAHTERETAFLSKDRERERRGCLSGPMCVCASLSVCVCVCVTTKERIGAARALRSLCHVPAYTIPKRDVNTPAPCRCARPHPTYT